MAATELLAPKDLLCTPAEAPAASRRIAKRLLYPEKYGDGPMEMVDIRASPARIYYSDDPLLLWGIEASERCFFFQLVYKSVYATWERALLKETKSEPMDRHGWYTRMRGLVLRNLDQFWFCLSYLAFTEAPHLPSEGDWDSELYLQITRKLLRGVQELLALQAQGRVNDDKTFIRPIWFGLWGMQFRLPGYRSKRVSSEQWEQFKIQEDPQEALRLMNSWMNSSGPDPVLPGQVP